MSRSGTIWKLLVEQRVEYEEHVEGKPYFDKIISLWKEYPNAIGNRITTVVDLEQDSALWNEVIAAFETKYQFSPKEKSELAINKFIKAEYQKFSENAFEVSFYEEEFLVRFYPVVLDGRQHPHFESPYSIACRIHDETSLQLQFFKPVDANEEHFTFMENTAFKIVATWLRTIDLSKTSRKTNALIDKESYVRNYREIRETFGRPICSQWTENSDPKKAVFEDCGIASYINSLVECDILPKFKKYVDIGCGNGLLVHLLNKIGYTGYGVDVRQRHVWKSLFKDDDLRESTVNPQIVVQEEPHFDAGVDLLIGNHSDELTPWIPVMAAKLNCNFFLIPCCPFNFFGKYRNNGSHLGPRRMVSQYESFFEWTVSVAERLGFHVKLDRLAIPSTKRLCIIGRVPEGGLCPDLDATIHLMTDGQKFVARPHEIRNNNCMNIPKPEREKIAKKLFEYILKESDEVREGWHCGAEVPLCQLATILTEEDKKLMKDQDGGLQTFMKNHHQIFHVYKASARLRDFRQPVVSHRKNWKPKKAVTHQAVCWMAFNHPDGCPVGESCRYAH
uniref:tRNA (uracil-O(2)-)-methyltransferase n=1 Tax=Caenorhabditis japonica TaxID=281687 RepID=A0A8R1DFG4_CAEJA